MGEPTTRITDPREYGWTGVPCGHPPEPVAIKVDGGWACHCAWMIDETRPPVITPEKAAEHGAPGPVYYCNHCGCHVAIPVKSDELSEEVARQVHGEGRDPEPESGANIWDALSDEAERVHGAPPEELSVWIPATPLAFRVLWWHRCECGRFFLGVDRYERHWHARHAVVGQRGGELGGYSSMAVTPTRARELGYHSEGEWKGMKVRVRQVSDLMRARSGLCANCGYTRSAHEPDKPGEQSYAERKGCKGWRTHGEEFFASAYEVATPLTHEDFMRALEQIADAPPRPPEYKVAPHHPRCRAVIMQEAEEPCDDPMGYWRYCDCGTAKWLAAFGYMTIKIEEALHEQEHGTD